MTVAFTISLFVKLTILLGAGVLLDALLRRKWVLSTAAMWNALLLAMVVLTPAMLVVPQLVLPVVPSQEHHEALPATVVEFSRTDADQRVPLQSHRSAGDDVTPNAANTRGFKNDSLPSGKEATPARTASLWHKALVSLIWIYAAGTTLAFVRLIASWRAVDNLRRNALPVTNPAWLERLNHWQIRLGLVAASRDDRARKSSGVERFFLGRRSARLLQSDAIDVPLALGVRDRVILIPSSMTEERNTLDSVLIHELAHVVRADYAWQLLERVLEAVLWFHPLVWIARRRIAFARERVCDEFTVHAVGDVDNIQRRF